MMRDLGSRDTTFIETVRYIRHGLLQLAGQGRAERRAYVRACLLACAGLAFKEDSRVMECSRLPLSTFADHQWYLVYRSGSVYTHRPGHT